MCPPACAIKYLTGQTPLLRNTTGNGKLHLKYALSPLFCRSSMAYIALVYTAVIRHSTYV